MTWRPPPSPTAVVCAVLIVFALLVTVTTIGPTSPDTERLERIQIRLDKINQDLTRVEEILRR